MNLKHRIKVYVLDPCKTKSTILTGGDHNFRSRLLTKLLGGKVGVLVLVPEGGAVSSVEIHEDPNGGDANEAV